MAVLYVLYVTSGSLRSDAAAFLYVLYVRDIRYLLYGYAVGGTSTTRYVYIYTKYIFIGDTAVRSPSLGSRISFSVVKCTGGGGTAVYCVLCVVLYIELFSN